MYIIGFIRSLLRPRKFLCSLYFLLNLVVVFFVFATFASFGGNGEDNTVKAGFIGIAVNIVVTLIALSPIGEAYVRMKEKVERVDRTPDTAGVYMIFDEVYAEAKKQSKFVGNKIKLYYKDTDEVNAYALGHRTVIITRGLINNMDADMIRGVLAHEFGHIASGDSDLKLGISVSNGILWLATIAFNLIIVLIAGLVAILSEKAGNWLSVLGITIVTLIYTIWVKLGMLLVNATSRKDEYAADAFAVDCGYGNHLYAALDALDGVKTKSSFFSLLASTHPDTVDRLKAIQAKPAA